MTLYIADDTFDPALFAKASCAVGVFDGLHTGHKFLIDQAIATAHSENGKNANRSMVITFDIDPDEVFHPNRLKKLMRNSDRLTALNSTGVNDVVVLPFTPELYSLSALDFLDALFGKSAPSHLHVGNDFRFGAKATGTVEDLRQWSAASGTHIHSHNLISADGSPITATRIRLLLEKGDVQSAAKLLGRPYYLYETVQKGRGDGTNFGFATANLEVKPHDRVLAEGVYAGYATVDNKRYKAAISVGVSPTFEEKSTANMEVHLLDFKGNLVGKTIKVEFIKRLRPMIKFDSTEDLITTVTHDINWVKENL